MRACNRCGASIDTWWERYGVRGGETLCLACVAHVTGTPYTSPPRVRQTLSNPNTVTPPAPEPRPEIERPTRMLRFSPTSESE